MSGLISADLAIGLACAAGFAILLAFIGLHQLLHREVQLDERLGRWGGGVQFESALAGADRATLRSRLDGAIAKRSFAAALQRDLARANLKLTVTEYVSINAAAVVVGGAIGVAIGNLPLAVALAVAGFYLPRLILGLAQKRRLKAFGSQLADTLMLQSNSLRAGYSLLQSMETVSREAPQPTAEEFGRVVREVGLGLSPEEALLNLYRRLPSDDLDLMVTAINVQHEVGGNLAKIFDTLAETIRERGRIQGEIKTLTAQQKIGGNVISIMPVVLAGGLTLMSPNYLKPLFSSETFICMPAFGLPILAAVMMVMGYFAIRRIVAIEV
ncbi:MAG TPA: type II secretion system F family protein [Chloroflexota bacterium]|jgi:tight adherence protein B